MRPIHQTFRRFADKAKKKVSPTRKITLSDFFPKDTVYFYGYPSGEDSGFLNLVHPSIEELVAARPLSCLGDSLSVLCFTATSKKAINPKIINDLNISYSDTKVICFPEFIDENLVGAERNNAIREFLLKNIKPGSLVMAQPFLNQEIKHLFQIDPELSNWLNDKKNMIEYIESTLLPKSYGVFTNGKELGEIKNSITLPCVIKVTSSSAGDGVYLCRDNDSLNKAVLSLSGFKGSILVEKLIDERKNYGIQFGIPHDIQKPIQIIGHSEQVVSLHGEFMGGIIQAGEAPAEVIEISRIILESILPKIRKMGWYGLGCFDVLVDKNGEFFIIDCNFRMTGMSAFLIMHNNQEAQSNLLSFNADFMGDEQDFNAKILPLTVSNIDQTVRVISLSKNKNHWRLNCAIPYTSGVELANKAQLLLSKGLHSKVLELSEELDTGK